MAKPKNTSRDQPANGSSGSNNSGKEDRDRVSNGGPRRRKLFGYGKHSGGKGKPSGGGMPYPASTNIEPPEKWGRA